MRAEDVIQKNICMFLDMALPPDSYYAAIPNGTVLAGDPKKRGMQMNKLKATGLKPGAPDLFILHRERFFAIEVKAEKGKLTDTQRDACDRIIAAGGAWCMARSSGDVERFLVEQGVVLRATVLK